MSSVEVQEIIYQNRGYTDQYATIVWTAVSFKRFQQSSIRHNVFVRFRDFHEVSQPIILTTSAPGPRQFENCALRWPYKNRGANSPLLYRWLYPTPTTRSIIHDKFLILQNQRHYSNNGLVDPRRKSITLVQWHYSELCCKSWQISWQGSGEIRCQKYARNMQTEIQWGVGFRVNIAI